MNRTGNCFQSNNVTHLVSIDNEYRNTHTLETVVALPVMNPTVLLLVPDSVVLRINMGSRNVRIAHSIRHP